MKDAKREGKREEMRKREGERRVAGRGGDPDSEATLRRTSYVHAE